VPRLQANPLPSRPSPPPSRPAPGCDSLSEDDDEANDHRCERRSWSQYPRSGDFTGKTT
jgi:hypothetical protein